MYCYAAGKRDWAGAGLPREGKLVAFPTAGDALRRDVPTCRLAERVADVRKRVEAAGWDSCVVADGDGTVLGMLRQKALHGDPDATAEAAMDPAPTTVRPSEPLADLALRMVQAGARRVLVTTPEGRLIGLLEREEALRRVGAAG